MLSPLVLVLLLTGILVLIVIMMSRVYRGKYPVDLNSDIVNEIDDTTRQRRIPSIRDKNYYMGFFTKRELPTLYPSESMSLVGDVVRTSVKGVDHDRWGTYIYDPDISFIDYVQLKEKDDTLPEIDPRIQVQYKSLQYSLDPHVKWLYFSNEYGSFAKRKMILDSDTKSTRTTKIMRKVYPELLTRRQSIESDKHFNIYDLKNQLPTSFIHLLTDRTKWSILTRYVIGRVFYSILPNDKVDE
jgi:hypothetical protein